MGQTRPKMSATHPILKGLNDKQIEAVQTINGSVLVISGPGSGKTKALTHRVAWMIHSSINPANILCITFTNKASREMRERIEKLLEIGKRKLETASVEQSQPTIGTFHSIGMRILRREIAVLGYSPNFSIFDADDQLSLMKRIMGKLVGKLYKLYQEELKKMNALDFDDLIVLTVRIFKEYPDTLKKYHEWWQYIMVDEYQDTSHDQYQFVKLLAKKHKNIFAIGDDAQSIYAFREADIRNILNFQKDYPDAKVIMLEQNYRSTQTILAAAQNIISNN